MTVPYRILVADVQSKSDNAKVLDTIRKVFEEVNAVYNNWNPESEISQLNQLPVHVKVKISDKLRQFLTVTDQLVQTTNGLFDPSVDPLVTLWKGCLTASRIPSPEEIEQTTASVGWDKISFEDGEFEKHVEGVSINVGGIAKGYAVDLISTALAEQGFTNTLVEWGGEIRAQGRHPEGRPWRIFVSALGSPDPEKAIAHLDLNNQSVATSGDYHQTWQVGDHVYSHVIHPITHTPIEVKKGRIASTTVLTDSCVKADALATTLLLFETAEEANTWATDQESIACWIATR